MCKRITSSFLFLAILINSSFASDAEIVKVVLEQTSQRWTIHVTLNHDDNEWEHYANGWRVVDKDGNIIGYRELHHPHKRQPFTRSLSNVRIPAEDNYIFIESSDNISGWGKNRLQINLRADKGPRYEIKRSK